MTFMQTLFSAKQAVGPIVRCGVLVNSLSFSPRYDLDRTRGRFSRTDHPLHGEELAGRILVSPSVQGGVAGGWAFLAMAEAGVGPEGLVFGQVNPVMVQGAVTASLPIMAGVEDAFLTSVRTGDLVLLDPPARQIRILSRAL